jgi:hypothetical protein
MTTPTAPDDHHDGHEPPMDPAFAKWRRVHRGASLVLALIAVVHSALTFRFYDTWSPNAVWFLGTGLGLLLLAVTNLAHVGIEPCRMPTTPLVRAANWLFVVFGFGALVAVREPQAAVIVLALLTQAVSAHRTLPSAP